ncbi:12473_t:CDS:2 [Entrophospora sp. SA101]|nr:12473_t:CDS:2 [Entrophospora sp. SA101]
MKGFSNILIEDFLNPVEENEIEEPVDEETIIQLIQEEGNENQNEEDDEGNELPVISAKEGLEALEKVMTFLLQQSRDCSDEIKKLASVKLDKMTGHDIENT